MSDTSMQHKYCCCCGRYTVWCRLCQQQSRLLGRSWEAAPTGIFVGVGALMRCASLAGGCAPLGILVGIWECRHACALGRL